MRADLREPSFAEVGVALVELARDCELQHAVAEELEPLVRRGPLARPGCMRVDLLRTVVAQVLDQLREPGDLPTWRATAVTRRSLRPGLQFRSAGRPWRRS